MARNWLFKRPSKRSRREARQRDPAEWATTERLRRFVRNHDVPGYFATHDMLVWDALLEFQEREHVRGHMLEIGVFKGRSASFSALFAGPEDHCWFLDIAMDPGFRSAVQARLHKRAHFIERSSYDVGEDPDAHFTGIGEFRWIHIDGQHTATAVANDLTIADRLLAPQGLVTVDDFPSPTWPHVAAGVFRFLGENPGRLELVLTAYNKGYLARREAVAYYQRFVRAELPSHFKSRNFDDFTLIESNLLDANDGLHCLGMGHRFEDRVYDVFDYRVGPEPRPE
jgi:hypothetical protein